MAGAGIRGGFRNPLLTGAEIPDGTITTSMLDDLAVTAAKLANSAVTAVKIANLAVGTAAIANLAVTGAKIASATITDANISSLNADKITAGTITALRYRTASSGQRLEIRGESAESFIRLFNSSGVMVGVIGLDATGFGLNEVVLTGSDNVILDAGAGIELTADGSAGFGVIVTNPTPAGGSPATPFGVVGSTGAGFRVRDGNSASTPTWAFWDNSGTGIFLPTDGTGTVMAFTVDGTQQFFTGRSGQVYLRVSTDGTASAPAFRINTTNTGLFRSGAGSLIGVAGGNEGWGVDTSGRFYIDRVLPDIGNHETLRANRDTTAALTQVGYFSSVRAAKREIVPLSRSKLWETEWFDQLNPVKFRRRSTQGREFGFIIDELAGIGPNGEGRFLTTKGEQVGHSPDEFALLAITVDAVKDLRRRVAELESRREAA